MIALSQLPHNPHALHAPDAMSSAVALRCAICHRPFNFAANEAAVVLRHVAYGYDFAHEGACLDAARELIFPEPDYDCAAFGRDPERRLVLDAYDAMGYAAVMAPTASAAAASLRLDSLRAWILVEHADGSRRMEGLVRDAEWLDEPGGAEFPEAARGTYRCVGYIPPGATAISAPLAEWERYSRERSSPAMPTVALPSVASLPAA